ncbi:MAG: PD-(D/E)XK nuclease family protein, partial [Rubrivivax sp.]
HALWLGVGALQVGKKPECSFGRSALGHLLTGGSEIEASEIGALLTFNVGSLPAVRIDAADEDTACTPLRRTADPVALAAPRSYRARFDRQWAIGSFSSLVSSLGSAPTADRQNPRGGSHGLQLMGDQVMQQELLAAAADEAGDGITADIERGRGDDEGSSAEPRLAQPALGPAPWHRFPRGALAGNFLHAQLQWLAEHGFGSPDADTSLAEALRLRCDRMGYGAQADDVQRWFGAMLATTLPPLSATLPELAVTRPELEFWMPAQQLSAARIDALCRQHLLPGVPRPPLPERSLHGMVMGFADLVFEHAGRWWVLDYKSNALGADDAAYSAEALAMSVAAHRYDVQAALYQLALHRLLRQRLQSRYDPALHLGGAIVLFLRGIRGPAVGCCHLPAELSLLQALDAELGGGGTWA